MVKIPSKLVKITKKLTKKLAKFRAEFAKSPHKSFRRSYREDYLRETSTPGLLSHAALTFKTIFKQWRLFLPFILLMILLYAVIVGLMSAETYQEVGLAIDETASGSPTAENPENSAPPESANDPSSANKNPSDQLAAQKLSNFAKAGLILFSTVTTGGFDASMDESGMMFMVTLFLIMWLVTIFLLRHLFAGEQPRLRDGLYNALGPLLSTLVIFVIIFIQVLPIMLVAITYSAAVTTGFLDTPFYALLYFIFAALMSLLSGYLLSSSLLALIAVTAPGLYPLRAMVAASDLAAGRRIRIVLRILYLILVVALIYIIVMLPTILLDMWLKTLWTALANLPVVSVFLVACTCFVFIYATTYLYIYYRWLLDHNKTK